MMDRKRVLHVITGLNVGGAETWLCRLLGGMAGGCWGKRLEHRVVTLLPCGPLAEPIRALGVEVESLGMSRGVPGVSDLGAVSRLAGIMRSWRPHVVQTWLYHADLLGFAARALALGAKPALSWGVRCAYMDFSRCGLATRLTVRACAALSGRVQTVVANSMAGAAHHVRELGYDGGTMRVLENGVDMERYRPDAAARAELRAEWGLGAGEVLAGLVARVDPMKGHDVFCHMARLVRHGCGEHVRFVFCGLGTRPGEEGWPEFQALLEESGLADSAVLLGQRRDVERVWAALDVAVLPSVGEGFPNALLEALACGVPAVALDVGDAAAIVGPGGAVVPATGDVEARARSLAAQVERLALAGGEERVRLGRAGRVHVSERYSLEAAVGGWAEHLYGLACLSEKKQHA